MAGAGEGPYSCLAENPEVLEAMYRLARGRGLVVNYSKEQIESSFTRPVFPSSRDDFARLLAGLQMRPQGFPGLHLTHAVYSRRPSSFGDEGIRDAFNFFLDIDGRTSLGPARRVVASMARALEDLNVPHWVKFSGSSGFHLHIPSSAFPARIDGRPFLTVAPDLFLDIKHFLVRRAGEERQRDLMRSVIHPKRYYGTSQGVQRMPFSLHEATGLHADPVPDEEIDRFNPRLARGLDTDGLEARLALLGRSEGSADGILAVLEDERGKALPFYHRR